MTLKECILGAVQQYLIEHGYWTMHHGNSLKVQTNGQYISLNFPEDHDLYHWFQLPEFACVVLTYVDNKDNPYLTVTERHVRLDDPEAFPKIRALLKQIGYVRRN